MASGTILALFGFALLILAPIVGRVMQSAVSRRRETLADFSGVEITRYPPGLISALEKLRDDYDGGRTPRRTRHRPPLDRAAAWPDEGRGPSRRLNRLFDTHPPLEERIAALREL